MRRLDRRMPPDRKMATLCYKLDQVLDELGQKGERQIIDRMIGILIITNEEFRSLFYQSLRNVEQATLSTIQVDMRTATIMVPSAFGILQTFVLDLDDIYPDQTWSYDPVIVPYSAIVLAALKSCLRSQMLMDCFHADPLFQMAYKVKDVVLIQ